MNEKIYCMNCESAFHIEDLLNYLNTHKDSLYSFEQTEDFRSANYALFVIGEHSIDNSAIAEGKNIIDSPLNTIVLVKRNLFEQYEFQRRSFQSQNIFSSNVLQFIQLFNENSRNRKWIYTYTKTEEIIPIVGNIVLSEYFEAAFKTPIIQAHPGEHFQNSLLLQNRGHIKLQGYYIDSFYGRKGGKYRPRLKNPLPVIGEIFPQKHIAIPLDFYAPDFAGAFISYIIIKKEGLILKMEDSIKSFVLHVSNKTLPSACDAVLLEESPENGKLYIEKTDFEKVWRLKNISNENWRKIILKVKYESVTHYFCKERKKIITNISSGSEFTVRTKFHPPDIPGKYTALFQLFRENGTEIITDAPLSCSVITQYETLSEFEVCHRIR